MAVERKNQRGNECQTITTLMLQLWMFGFGILLLILAAPPTASGFMTTGRTIKQYNANSFLTPSMTQLSVSSSDDNNNEEEEETESQRLKKQAEKLREEIRAMEEKLQSEGKARTPQDREDPEVIIARNKEAAAAVASKSSSPLQGKRVLVVGANGRLGSMVCRYLLRNHPQTEVVAAVHYVGEASTRGYGRLSYEVGAEDGVGTINPAWDMEDRNARFEWTPDMADYNLQNLRVVEVELLDPVQTMTICEDVDCVLWCATDFNGNKPRSIGGPFNAALLFRAVVDPTKGRVEIEGLRNVLGGLKNTLSSKRWNFEGTSSATGASSMMDSLSTFGSSSSTSSTTSSKTNNNEPVSFVLVSASPSSYNDFETPLGSFHGLKRDGERILREEFPSLSYTVLRMSRYEDNFVDEGLDVEMESNGNDADDKDSSSQQEEKEKSRRRINRRDAAKATVDALIDPSLKGKVVDVWTAIR